MPNGDRIKLDDVTRLFQNDGAQLSGMREVEITPEMRQQVPVTDATSLPTGRPIPSRLRRIGEGVQRGTERAGQFLAQDEVQMALGQFAQAFGQGDPTSPATILGGQVQKDVRQRAEAEVMSRLLAGEDPSEIDQQTLALAGPQVRQQALLVTESRAGRKLEEEKFDFEKEAQKEAFRLQELGIDIQQEGLDQSALQLGLSREDFEHRSNLAVQKQELQERIGQSLIDYRRAQAEAASEQGTEVDKEKTLLRNQQLIQDMSKMIENRTQHLESMKFQLEDVERTLDIPGPPGIFEQFLQPVGAAIRGERVDAEAERERRQYQPPDPREIETQEQAESLGAEIPKEYFELRGRIVSGSEQLERLKDIHEDLVTQQANALSGSLEGQEEVFEPLEETEETAPLQNVSTMEEYEALPAGTRFHDTVTGIKGVKLEDGSYEDIEE